MSDLDGPRLEREHERYRVEISVDWSTGRMFVTDRVSNISQGGVFVRSSRPMALHQDVNLVLWLPDGRPVRAVGRVVWCHDVIRGAGEIVAGRGVKFAGMEAADRALLDAYLRDLAAGPPERGH